MSIIEANINDVVAELIGDDEKKVTTDENGVFNHPEKEAIIDILSSLRQIIFPRYFRNRAIKVYTLKNNLSMLIEDVVFKLTKQIAIVLDKGVYFNGRSGCL